MEDNCPSIKRHSLKTHPRFNNYSFWTDKLRENCYKRVREDRTRLLWKLMLPAAQSLNHKEFIKSAFQDIVTNELKKLKDLSLGNCLENSNSVSKATDELWEYNGLQDAHQGECGGILLEMQQIFYQYLRTESAVKEPEERIETWEDEEDEYLARAVYEHLQLNDEQVHKQIWCPICKQGELQQNHQLIYCSLCKLKLDRDDEVNLDMLRDRLAEAHADHFDRGCRLKPKFCQETRFGLTALYILCQDCSTFEVVIYLPSYLSILKNQICFRFSGVSLLSVSLHFLIDFYLFFIPQNNSFYSIDLMYIIHLKFNMNLQLPQIMDASPIL